MPKCLVIIETAGNQAYIFATNKRRENVGASHLVYCVGAWAIEASRVNEGQVIVAISGKAVIVTNDRAHAEKIVQHVTVKALKEAPGLDVRGAVVEFDYTLKGYLEAERQAHDRLLQLRAHVSGPELRFLRLPVVEECKASPYPAAKYEKEGKNLEPRSAVSIAKRKNGQDGLRRLRPKLVTESIYDHFEQEAEWVAVIHADGNGIGQKMMALGQKSTDLGTYLKQLHALSRELDDVNRQAFEYALSQITNEHAVLPLILGGDDLTVLCDGSYAFDFIRAYLTAFEEKTKANVAITEVFGEGLTSSAGMAFVKPHYPFHAAYHLAEELLSATKNQVKAWDSDRHYSAIDWHILYDSSASSLGQLRLHWQHDDTQIHGRPYVITPVESITSAKIKNHHIQLLDEFYESISQQNHDGENSLPRSMLHQLREGLLISKNEADARLKLVQHRYPGLNNILPHQSLFIENTSRLLDALDLQELKKESEADNE